MNAVASRVSSSIPGMLFSALTRRSSMITPRWFSNRSGRSERSRMRSESRNSSTPRRSEAASS